MSNNNIKGIVFSGEDAYLISKGNYGKMLANRRGKRQPGNGRSRS